MDGIIVKFELIYNLMSNIERTVFYSVQRNSIHVLLNFAGLLLKSKVTFREIHKFIKKPTMKESVTYFVNNYLKNRNSVNTYEFKGYF